MATGQQLWNLSQARLNSAKTLMQASDWDGAAYMMGYAAETALKAASCKSLNLSRYPENTGSKHIDNCFMTHKFDQLLVISGCSDVFEASAPPETSSKWSEFVQNYPGEWVTMRYNPDTIVRYNSVSVSRIYEVLFQSESSILKTIRAKQRWS
jgi:hypothetical protein